MEHAYILHSSMKAGTRSEFRKYEPEIDGVTMARFSNDLLSEDEVAQIPKNPTLFVTHPFECDRIPEVFGALRGRIFITPKMRDYFEQMEPGVHRYFPVLLQSEIPIAGKTEHGEHYLLLPPPLIDCLVIEETACWKGYGLEGWSKGEGGKGGGSLSPTPNEKCTLKKSIVEGHHLWRTKVGDRSEYTCSDEFWDGVKNEWQIWAPHTQCILKRVHLAL